MKKKKAESAATDSDTELEGVLDNIYEVIEGGFILETFKLVTDGGWKIRLTHRGIHEDEILTENEIIDAGMGLEALLSKLIADMRKKIIVRGLEGIEERVGK